MSCLQIFISITIFSAVKSFIINMHKRKRSRRCCKPLLQWNPSNLDTNGAKEIVTYDSAGVLREGLHYMYVYLIVGPAETADEPIHPTALLIQQQKSSKEDLQLNWNHTHLRRNTHTHTHTHTHTVVDASLAVI